jgi:segregation and condensation protein B
MKKIPKPKQEAHSEMPPVPKSNPEETELEENRNQLEAVLFASGKYLDEETLSSLCGIDKRRIRKVLESLKSIYDGRPTALALFQEGESWKINVREKYISLVRKIVSDTELNKSSMETLAVIAWKSPALQSDIVRIRGNKCYDHIDELDAMGFITKEKKGRSYVLKTTEKFFDYFDIDKKHIQEVLEDVKIPELKKVEQTTLKPPETIPADQPNKIEAINIMKRTETEEEKQAYANFLGEMEKKLDEVSQKNAALEQDIPKPMHMQESDTPSSMTDDLPAEHPVPPSDLPPQQPEENIKDIEKRKSLTKKQLEKKFKDDILKVREKMKK